MNLGSKVIEDVSVINSFKTNHVYVIHNSVRVKDNKMCYISIFLHFLAVIAFHIQNVASLFRHKLCREVWDFKGRTLIEDRMLKRIFGLDPKWLHHI
jgi:hypothetical protein